MSKVRTFFQDCSLL